MADAVQHLFVYGSLQPGGSNAHVLQPIAGTWRAARVHGELKLAGWGAAIGYPGLVLDPQGSVVDGHVLSSDRLDSYWETLDQFEGAEYQRVLTDVELEDGSRLGAHVYVVRVSGFPAQPTLEGPTLRLRPIAADDFDALYAVASDAALWAQHPARDRHKKEVFRDFFDEAIASCGAFVVIDRVSEQVIGSSRYHGYDAERDEVEIGWTFLARSHWGGRANGELKTLMLDYAFRYVSTVLFFVGEHNLRSRRAVEKIGGRLRAGAISRGGIGHHVVFEIRRADWLSS